MTLTRLVSPRLQRVAAGVARRFEYELQKRMGWGVDLGLKFRLRDDLTRYRAAPATASREVSVRPICSFDFTDEERFVVFKDDIYRRFVAAEGGPDRDDVDRCGYWVPRGAVVFYDAVESTFVKLFDEFAAVHGEARYLGQAIESGMYDFLCPDLDYLIRDGHGRVRGYAIGKGTPISRWEFEQYMPEMQQLIFEVTERTGLYFTDLTYHNVVKSDGRLCLIDLESVLPVEWYGTDMDFAFAHIDEVDVGWALQSKWKSPDWYGEFVTSLQLNPTF